MVTDGNAVLGLGGNGLKAAITVMEGKAMFIKEFADIDSSRMAQKSILPERYLVA